ncbi:MAG: stage 0 sporulation family protein [Phycisphaerales bacterium]
MPIHPLPQFEADLAEDRRIYERLKPPTSMVVRFGIMKLVGEYPYSGDAKPGCGSKVVVRTHRGVELAEMLTTTCPNAGCSKSVTRKEMLEYIENSGGREYPFFNQGRVLRIATVDDLNQQAKIDAERPKHVMRAREVLSQIQPPIPMKIVDAEPILGGEKITFYFTSEDRVDFRDLVSRLASEHHTRIEMRQVGARDEARLVADYERCGQHCCCKQFLKVLKPISMKSAKIQKATLDPLKISGRCGRLMCCLRYEDESYDELRKRLPKKKVRLRTPEGWGIVMDTQILTQLVLLRLEHIEKDVAFTVEDLQLVDGKQTPEVVEAITAASPVQMPEGPPPGVRDGGRSSRDERRAGPGGATERSQGQPAGPRSESRGGAGREDGRRNDGERSSPGRPPARGRTGEPRTGPGPGPGEGLHEERGEHLTEPEVPGTDDHGEALPGPGTAAEGGGERRRRRRRRRRGPGGSASGGPEGGAGGGGGGPRRDVPPGA